MWDAIFYLAVVAVIAALTIGGAFLARVYLSGGNAGTALSGFFGPKPYRRLEVVDHASVDGRRKLVLVRRDEVEHLVMIGGPVDVVIETGIQPPPPRPREPTYGR